MTRYVTVGKTTSPHGIKGWIKVMPLTHDPGRFENLESVSLARDEHDPGRRLSIAGVKYQARNLLVKFEGIDSRDDAERLRHCLLRVPEEEIPPIEEEDTYYHYQLEGMEVKDTEGEVVGRLTSVIDTGSNDIYAIAAPDGKTEYYLPALKSCVISVDVEKQQMVVDRNWLT